MSVTFIAFLWHQHQPYYKNVASGLYVMPWLRLHAVKDYYGMAALIEETPDFKATINFVPSALLQLRDYVENKAQDLHLMASRKPARDLSDEDKTFILKNFFIANFDQMIAPYPRYRDLHQRVRPGEAEKKTTHRRFSAQDWLDLQVWANLAWFHPLSIERTPELRELLEKGRGFTEEEKHRVLELQWKVMAEVIPLHRRLQERGQIEISTTPFYHPILPLLCDPTSARVAMPGVPLPRGWMKIPEDARAQLARAVTYYEECFGTRPRGMWPSEGSVSPDVVPLFLEQGIQWIATDEEILAHSIGAPIVRSPSGEVTNPEVLYRPYFVGAGGKELAVVFRDHLISDLIGFHYQGRTPEQAVDDLVGRLERVADRSAGRDLLVPIILDGENAWEFYRNQGVDFLRGLYRRLARHPRLRPTRIGEAVQRASDRPVIRSLFPGSWINHNFAIWIGHPEDNTAWEHVYAARRRLVEKSTSGQVSEAALRRAWEELYVAEGSDWYWWYGEDHVTAQMEEFDALFRAHLKAVYEAIGETPPLALDTPITRAVTRRPYTQPRALLQVTVDGRSTSYFEWVDGGRCDLQTSGAMTESRPRLLTTLWFGFDATNFFLRLDGRKSLRNEWPPGAGLRVAIHGPKVVTIAISGLREGAPTLLLERAGVALTCERAACAIGQILELAVPFHDLELTVGTAVDFFVEVVESGQVIERAPSAGAIRFEVPSPDFERIVWQV